MRNEGGNVVSGRDDDVHGPVGALVPVDLLEALAERVSGDADNGVDVGIEVGAAAQRLDGDVVLLDLILAVFKVLFADEGEHAGEVIRPAEDARGQEPGKLLPFRFYRIGGHYRPVSYTHLRAHETG